MFTHPHRLAGRWCTFWSGRGFRACSKYRCAAGAAFPVPVASRSCPVCWASPSRPRTPCFPWCARSASRTPRSRHFHLVFLSCRFHRLLYLILWGRIYAITLAARNPLESAFIALHFDICICISLLVFVLSSISELWIDVYFCDKYFFSFWYMGAQSCIRRKHKFLILTDEK